MKEVPPPLIPLTNGLIPANFAALFASATGKRITWVELCYSQLLTYTRRGFLLRIES